MKRNERLILAMGEIDEKYIKEAEVKMHTKSIVAIAAVLLIFIGCGLFLFVPYAPVTSDISAYADSSYYPLIEEIEAYRLGFMQPEYNNNFEAILGAAGDLVGELTGGIGGLAPDYSGGNNMSSAPESDGNGSYVESTDNQVDGVIESDLMKMTERYIFRLAYRTQKDHRTNLLRVYSIEKEDSALVAEFDIPSFDDEFKKSWHDAEMFLSEDGNTVTVVRSYTDNETNLSKVGVTSVDVSDVNDIKLRGTVSIDGSLNTSRKVDGKIMLVSEFVFNRSKVDYNNPATFVPTIDMGNGDVPIEFEDIIYPNEVGNTRYSVVTLLDEDTLTLLGASALLNFIDEVYVSAENVYITRSYVDRTESDGEERYSNMTDIAVLNYSGDTLEKRGVVTVRGWAEDQYSFDERDGHLRVVTTTVDGISKVQGESVSYSPRQNVSLYVFNLKDNSLAASLEDFAIEGEEATAVRFTGDTVYVCTAVKINFTDPVYFIDLSDYENITSADTGIIEGYSEHLINFGDGFALGIGREDWQYSKVEVYEQNGSEVVSVDELKFDGNYSLEYKAYLVDRENMLFGFAAEYFNGYDNPENYYHNAYVLIHFNGYELSATVIDLTASSLTPDTVRAAYIDGYLYITTLAENGFMVVEVK